MRRRVVMGAERQGNGDHTRCRNQTWSRRRDSRAGVDHRRRTTQALYIGLRRQDRNLRRRLRNIPRHRIVHRIPELHRRGQGGQGYDRYGTDHARRRGHAHRCRREGGTGAAHIAERRHGKLQRRRIQGIGRRRRRGSVEEDARHYHNQRHGRGAGRGGQEDIRRRQGVLRRGCLDGDQLAAGTVGRQDRGIQQALGQRRIFGHGRRRGVQGHKHHHA